MWLVDTLSKIFKSNDNKSEAHEAIVREMTFIGERHAIEGIYVVQESTSEGIKNYCISATKEDREKIWYQLLHLKNTSVYFYLQSRLLIEPFIENDFEKVMGICKMKLPGINAIEFSTFML